MNKLSKYITYSVIIIGIIIALFLLKDWWKPTIIEGLGGYTQKETKIRVDTVEVKVDSIFPVYKDREVVVVTTLDTKTKTKIDSILNTLKKVKEDKDVEGDLIDSLRFYSYNIEDTILKGYMNTITNSKDGSIVSQDFKYTPKIPIYIDRTTTIEKETSSSLSNNKKPMFGAGLEINSEKDYGVNLFYKTNNNILINVGAVQATDVNRNDYIKVGIGFLF